MKDYTEQNPVFMDTIQITETSDPAHADNINAAPMQLLQNTLVNQKEIDELKKGSNEVEFDDSGTGTDIPGGGGEEPGENLNPADAIDQITSGKSVPTLIGHIKTALRGLLSLSQSLQTLFFEKISGLPGLIGRSYSEEQVYGIGEYCTHEERFYKFTGSKEIGAWNPDKVQEVTVAEELLQQRAAVQEIVDSMGNPDAYDPDRLYMAGDFCIQNNRMYKRNEDMASDTELPNPWNETEWTATSIAEEIRQLNVNMSSDMVIARIVTTKYSIGGNTGTHINAPVPMISGYKPIAAIAEYSESWQSNISSVSVSNTKVSATLYNISASSFSNIDFRWRVLYVRDAG